MLLFSKNLYIRTGLNIRFLLPSTLTTQHTETTMTKPQSGRKQRAFRIHRDLLAYLAVLTPFDRSPVPSTTLARVIELAASQPYKIPPAFAPKAPLYTGFSDNDDYVGMGATLPQIVFETFCGAAHANLRVAVERGYTPGRREIGTNLLANQMIWAFSQTTKGQRLWDTAASAEHKWEKYQRLMAGGALSSGRPPKYTTETPV